MAYLTFFPNDSRSSQDKLNIIQKNQQQRLQTMKSSDSFNRYDEVYWDTGETIGYGGYRYDGRYKTTAEKIIQHYQLKPGDSVLEVACGKGFLLVEFLKLGMKVCGIELSQYAVENAHPEVKPFIHCDDFCNVSLEDKAFDFVCAKDCLPHMPERDIPMIIDKCIRTSKGHCFFEIEVARNAFENEMLYQWDVTHITRQSPEWWETTLMAANYQGDYHFKVLVEDHNLPSIDQWRPQMMLTPKINALEIGNAT